MNKYDVLIREFLIINKVLSLEMIGTLSLSTATDESDDSTLRQPGTFSFKYDKRAVTSSGLIDFISEKTGKKRSLIESDLCSYFEQIRQFINIGKPYEIEGVGILKVNKLGEYDFFLAELCPQQPIITKASTQNVRWQKSTRSRKKPNKALNAFALIILLAVLAGLGWWAYQYFINNDFSTWHDNMSNDSLNNANTLNDATATEPIQPTVVKYIFDSSSSLNEASQRVAALQAQGRQVMFDSIENNGLKTYRFFIQQNMLLTDTAHVKDSLEKQFSKKIQIEISGE